MEEQGNFTCDDLVVMLRNADLAGILGKFDFVYDENTGKYSLLVSRGGGKKTFSEEYTGNQSALVIIPGEEGFQIQVVGVYVTTEAVNGEVHIDYEDDGQKLFRMYASRFQSLGEDDFAYIGEPGKGVTLTSTTGDNALFVAVNYRKIKVET